MGKKKDIHAFIDRARQLYGDLYDYSETVYSGHRQKLSFKCNGCGTILTARATDHIRCDKPSGCRKCGVERSLQKRGKAKACVACGERLRYSPVRDYCDTCKPWWKWAKRAMGKLKHATDRHTQRHGTPWDSWATCKANGLMMRARIGGRGKGMVRTLRLDWHCWVGSLSLRTEESPWQKKARQWQRSLNLRERMQRGKNC